MKNRLLFAIMFAFIFSSCSNFSGNEDEVEASLKPVIVTTQNTETEEEEEEEEDTVIPRTWYDLYGVSFGDNTFVAVGERGTVRYSSDNGSSWDNGTSGTTSLLYEIAYGDQTFVAVGQTGTIRYSNDNGTTWSSATWNDSEHLYGVAYGNNTFVGVASENAITSTDNGLNWAQKGGANLYDVTFGNSTFVGCGPDGGIDSSTNNGTNWTSQISGATTYTLYGITFGNNQFFSVGSGGKLIKSTDNGNSWSNVDSRVSSTLNSIAFGTVGSKDFFIGVGSSTVIVSEDNGTSFILKNDTLTFKDITYGNELFVAVGNDENIYTSTDGNTWTKVYGK